MCQGQDSGIFPRPSTSLTLGQTTSGTHISLNSKSEHSYKKYADYKTLSSEKIDLRFIGSTQPSIMEKSSKSSVTLQRARSSNVKALANKNINTSDAESSPTDISSVTHSKVSLGTESTETSSLVSPDQKATSVSPVTSHSSLGKGDEQTQKHSSSDSDVSMPDMVEVMQRFGIEWAPSMVRRMEKAEERSSSDGSTNQGS